MQWANFWEASKGPDPRRRRCATPKYVPQKSEFPEIAEHHDCEVYTVPSGLPAHQETLFF